MAEKRFKVYATAEEQKVDEAEAVTHGWVVLERGWTRVRVPRRETPIARPDPSVLLAAGLP